MKFTKSQAINWSVPRKGNAEVGGLVKNERKQVLNNVSPLDCRLCREPFTDNSLAVRIEPDWIENDVDTDNLEDVWAEVVAEVQTNGMYVCRQCAEELIEE